MQIPRINPGKDYDGYGGVNTLNKSRRFKEKKSKIKVKYNECILVIKAPEIKFDIS